MLKETKEAFLKHDLYKLVFPDDIYSKSYKFEDLPIIGHKKIASKGARFVYCETNMKDAGMGWFADAGSGNYREGNCGFGKMSNKWADENLTEPIIITGTKFRNQY